MQSAITAFIGLGSNLGDGLTTLQKAWAEINTIPQISTIALSHPYLSEPVAMTSSNWFTNAVGELQTTLSADELLGALMQIESSFGRLRNKGALGYQDRTLDLDILYFGNLQIQSKRLHLPHPHLSERLFVLEPLAEIAPDLIDPQDGLTMEQKRAALHRDMNNGTRELQGIKQSSWT